MPIPPDLKKAPFIKKVVLVINKMDLKSDEEDYEIFLELSELKIPCIGLSTRTGRNLTSFVEKLYQMSDIIRIYTKMPGKEPDMTSPFVLPKGSPLEELAMKIHKDFTTKIKFAKIWGKDVYDGQMVQKDYVLQDGDVAEIHL